MKLTDDEKMVLRQAFILLESAIRRDTADDDPGLSEASLTLIETARKKVNALVEAAEKDPLDRAIPGSVELRKFSSKTYKLDVLNLEMSEDTANALRSGERRVGELWRARVSNGDGEARRWWYGWSAREALTKALGGGE